MAFWDVADLRLEEFRPGVLSRAELGKHLIMVCMEIGAGLEDKGHEHPFDQCGIVLEGEIEMFIGEDRMRLGPNGAYFVPAGEFHGWKTFDSPVKLLDVSQKPNSG